MTHSWLLKRGRTVLATRLAYFGVNVAEHFCQFVIHFPEDQSDKVIRCDKPAGIKYNLNWLCAEHYDIAEEGRGYACAKFKGEE
jgi:hypothetical protein